MGGAVRRAPAGLSAPAAAFKFVVVWATVAAALVLGLPPDLGTEDWVAFAGLLPLVAYLHGLTRARGRHQGSDLSLAPMFAAALVLPPLLATTVIASAFVSESLRTRVAWHIGAFNTANVIGPALAARVVFDAIGDPGNGTAWGVGAAAALAMFLAMRYAVLAAMLRLTRGVRLRQTIRLESLVIDAGLLSLGAAGAALAEEHPALVLLLAVPLALVYRAVEVPQLVETSRVDAKTGLFNRRHFQASLEQELARAERFNRTLSLLKIEVDRLPKMSPARVEARGDRALTAVAQIVQAETRDYDVPACLDGDGFSVLLPETDEAGALAVGDRIRAGVERAGRSLRLPLTVSIGVASATGAGTTPAELVALADRAAANAKLSGRNTVALAPPGDPVREAERVLREALREER